MPRFLSTLLLIPLLCAKLAGAETNDFDNSMGLHFKKVPGTSVLMCIWKCRVSDYNAFVSATGRKCTKPPFVQTPNDPAVNISWEDAKAFAYWLTGVEHASGKLPADWFYRLPSDIEWSRAAGLSPSGEETGYAAEDNALYPWGKDWPPPPGCGNYSPSLQVDKYPYTSPVGSFPANKLGFFDLGGNAWEWCEDTYNRSPDYRILRGASWRMKDPGDLLLSNRIGNVPDLQLPVYGFRLVIEMPKPPEPPPLPTATTSSAIPKK
ncbi:MAG: SUMF1/EgtB/PvdO family nonheme iron enzyme [Methylacidiphilales bacterium]|nr:SUMF1/EgtB/PvdO family nonheme iron enzyme [Candidatus Methylacidiphilales bacterium]